MSKSPASGYLASLEAPGTLYFQHGVNELAWYSNEHI